MSDNNLAEVIQQSASYLATLRNPTLAEETQVPVIMLPDFVKPTSLEQFLVAPRRIKENITFNNPASFADFFKRFAPVYTPMLRAWESGNGMKVACVFDYHGVAKDTGGLIPAEGQEYPMKPAPAWGNFTATLDMDEDNEFKTWHANNNKFLTQGEFAEFLDANLHNIVQPDAAELLEMAQYIEGTTKAVFRAGQRLASGEVSLAYDESAEITGGKKKLMLPAEITISVRIFRHGPRQEIKARLRYRITDKAQVMLAYQIPQLEDVLLDAYRKVIAGVEADTGSKVYWTKS